MTRPDGARTDVPGAEVRPGRYRMVTVADVARHAGVSAPTVSKVLNGRSTVSPRTRERVEGSMRALGYVRRRRLKGRSNTLELVFHRLESQWALEIIRGVQSRAQASGYGVVVSEAPDGHQPSLGWFDEVFARRSVAVVCASAALSERQRAGLAARSIPLVALDPDDEPVRGCPSVAAANYSGGHAAARHLLDLGHRRIAAIAGPDRVACARARLGGYRAALSAAGVPVGAVRSGGWVVGDGYHLAREILATADRPTAIVTGNDLQAIGVYRAAREAGLRIPADLSVVGFDDLDAATWVDPPLTTVRQPLHSMAAAATVLALQVAAGDQPPTTRIEVPTTLVVRQSTAPSP